MPSNADTVLVAVAVGKSKCDLFHRRSVPSQQFDFCVEIAPGGIKFDACGDFRWFERFSLQCSTRQAFIVESHEVSRKFQDLFRRSRFVAASCRAQAPAPGSVVFAPSRMNQARSRFDLGRLFAPSAPQTTPSAPETPTQSARVRPAGTVGSTSLLLLLLHSSLIRSQIGPAMDVRCHPRCAVGELSAEVIRFALRRPAHDVRPIASLYRHR